MENKKSQARDYRVKPDNDTEVKFDNDKTQKSSERMRINYQMMVRLPKIHAHIKSKKYPNKNDIIKYLEKNRAAALQLYDNHARLGISRKHAERSD